MAASPKSSAADPFSLATDSFLGASDLVGRVVLFYAGSQDINSQTREGANGQEYNWATVTVHVLSGEVTEDIPAIPCVLEDIQFSAGDLVTKASAIAGKFGPDGRPKVKVGEIKTLEAKKKGFSPPIILGAVESMDESKARELAMVAYNSLPTNGGPVSFEV